MGVLLSETNYSEWQLSITTPGAIVTDKDAVAQSFYLALVTPMYSSPLRPEFGSGLFELVDSPINEVLPNIVKVCKDVARKWVPNIISIDKVVLEKTVDPGHLKFTVYYTDVYDIAETRSLNINI